MILSILLSTFKNGCQGRIGVRKNHNQDLMNGTSRKTADSDVQYFAR